VLSNKESQSRLPRGSIYYQLGEVYFDMNDISRAKNYYLLSIASDTAEVGKKRWITPRSHLKVATCYEMLGEVESAKYHLGLIHEDDNERAYEEAQERLENRLQEIDIDLIVAKNYKDCNQFDLALNAYQEIKEKYAQSTDPYVLSQLNQVDYSRAVISFELEQYDKAIIQFQQIIEETTDKDEWYVHWSYFYLGNCYKILENYDSAKAAYNAADDTDDDWLLARIEDERKDLPEK
jgi:tetratricopeptide (TPR) repeat protein